MTQVIVEQDLFCEFADEELPVLWRESRERFYKAIDTGDSVTYDVEREFMYQLFNEMALRDMI
jgi:hypothetical protein